MLMAARWSCVSPCPSIRWRIDPGREEAPYNGSVYSVPLRVRRDELLAAAQAWDEHDRRFHER